jgi:PKD repeat protein
MRTYFKKCSPIAHKMLSIVIIIWLFGGALLGGILRNVEAAKNNTPPMLTDGNIDSLSGNVTKKFRYTVNYTDVDNNTPEMYVSIDGTNYTMNEVNESDRNYSDGKEYYYEKGLTRGDHNYSFIAYDGKNTNSTTPFSGPSVTIDKMNNVLLVFSYAPIIESIFTNTINENMNKLLDHGINVTRVRDIPSKDIGNFSVIILDIPYMPDVPGDGNIQVDSVGLEVLKRYLENGNGLVLLGDSKTLRVSGVSSDSFKTWFGVGTVSQRPSNYTASLSVNQPFNSTLSTGAFVYYNKTNNPDASARPTHIVPDNLASSAETIARWDDNKTFAYKHTYDRGRVFYQGTNLISMYNTIDDEKVKNNLTELLVAGTRWAYNVDNQSLRPDFIPTKIELSKGRPSQGENTTVNFTIKNQGNAPGTTRAVLYDETPYGRITLFTSDYIKIDQNESSAFSYQWTPPIGGNHTIVVNVDPDYEVSENNKPNNVLRSNNIYVNTPPRIGSMAEFDNKKVPYGTPIIFACSAEDDDVLNDAAFKWYSNKTTDPIGIGKSITVSNLSVGKHIITFEVTDSNGMTARSSINLTIVNMSELPVVKITTPLDSSVYTDMETIRFDCEVKKGTPPYSYSWKINEENVSDQKSFETSKASGKYNISITVRDIDNFVTSDKISIDVIEQTGLIWLSKVDSSSGSWSVDEDDPDYSINVSVYNNGSYAETVKIVLKDANQTQEKSVSIPSKSTVTTDEFKWSSSYTRMHRITIEVVRKGKVLNTTYVDVEVKNKYPIAQIRFLKTDGSVTKQIYEGDTVLLDAKNSQDTPFDKANLICTWESNGTIIKNKAGINETVSWKFQKPGTYNIKLIVKDDNFATDTITVPLPVINRAPTADAGADMSVDIEDSVPFYGKGTDPSEDAWMLNYYWDFGDKTSSREMNPTHRYKEPGVYTVVLTVTDSYGESSTSITKVTVKKADKHLVVSIVSPGDRDTIKQKTTIKVSTTDTAEKVEIYINGALFSDFKKAPFEISWDTTTGQYQNGRYVITAVAYDSTTAEKTMSSSEVIVYVENPTTQPEAVVAATVVGTATAVGSATILSGTVATAGVGKLSMLISKIKDWATQYGGQYTEDVLKEKADQKVRIEGRQGFMSSAVLVSLFLSVVTLVVFYSFVESGGIFNFSTEGFIDALPEIFIASATVIVVIELVVAFSAGISNLRFGYKNWPGGIFALGFSSILMMPFGMPGRSIINKEKTSERTIAMIGLSKSSIILSFALLFAIMMELGGTLYKIGEYGMGTSLMLFMYTVLPFKIIEGGDIFKWNKATWAGLFVLSIVLFYGWELSALPHSVYFLGGALGVATLSYSTIYQLKSVRGYIIGTPTPTYADMMIDPYGEKTTLREKKNLFVFAESEFAQLSETPYGVGGEAAYLPPPPKEEPRELVQPLEQQTQKEEPKEMSPYEEEKPTKWIIPYTKREKGVEGDEWLDL